MTGLLVWGIKWLNEAAEAVSVHRENPFIKSKTIEKLGWLRYSKHS